MLPYLPAVVALLALAFSIITTITTLLTRATVAEMRNEQTTAIAEARQELDERLEAHDRRTGETFVALRQKLMDVEIWNRDNFARRDSYQAMRIELSNKIDAAMESIDKRLERIEKNQDALRGQSHRSA